MESTRRESEYLIRNLVEQRDLSASRVDDYKSLLVESDRVRKMFYDQWYHLGKRTLLKVTLSEGDEKATASSVERLMGNKAEARFEFIQEKAEFANEELLDV